MPNWCFTSCTITGDKKSVRDLYDIMKSLEDREETLVPNGFGKTWLGNLVTALGGDWNEVHCRGDWQDLRIDEYEQVICLSIESAWSYPEELFDFIHEKCPGVDIYFQAEEPSMGIYVTNDVDGVFYPDRYTISYNDDIDFYAMGEMQEFLEDLSKIVNAPVNNIEEAWSAVCEYNADREDDFVEIQVYDVIK